jgi:hypothetical protein
MTSNTMILADQARRLSAEIRGLADRVATNVDPIAALPARHARTELEDLADLLEDLDAESR